MSTAPVLLTHNGITDSISGWARRTGIGKTTLSARLKRADWPLERCLEKNPTPRKRNVRSRKKGKLIRGPRCWYNV
jgi:hypothetical protein